MPNIPPGKYLRVRYTYGNDIEQEIKLAEGSRMVLPKQVERGAESKIIVTGLLDGDPRIEPSFFDGRHSPIGGVESLELKNRGLRTAYRIRISPIQLRKRAIHFPQIVDSLASTDFSQFYGDVGTKWGADAQQHFIRALSEEWAGYSDYETRREIAIPARIDYEDEGGVRFECNFDLIYHGGRGWNQPSNFDCVECRNLQYRRIPKGITQ